MNREFDKLCKENERSLMYMAMKYSNFHKENAEDLLQDTLLKAGRAFHSYKPDFKFTTWVGRIMRNRAIDEFRKSKDMNVSSLDTTDELNICNMIPNGEYSAFMDSFDIEYLRKHAKEVLSPKLLAPYEMWAQSMAYKEICAKLDLPMGTVKARVHEARSKIIETFPK